MTEQKDIVKIDTLNRSVYIENVQHVIDVLKNNGKGGYFAISAGWGYGKTFVLEKLESKLSADADCIIIHYDCWKYDYYEEPLVALLASVADQLQDSAEQSQYIKNAKEIARIALKAMGYMAWESLLECGSALSKAKLFGVDIVKAAKEAYKDIKTDLNATDLPDYDTNSSLRKSLRIMQAVLNKLASEKKLVIVIDELDRCLPAYQIKILERMHHLIDGQSSITIYAINPEQLRKTIEQMYGGDSEERTNAYLKKFIDFQVPLLIGSMQDNIFERYCNNLADFEEIPDGDEYNDFCDIISNMFSECDARTINKIWAKQSLIHRLVYGDKNDSSKPSYKILCAELMILVILQWQKKVHGVGSVTIPNNGKPVSPDLFLFSARFTPADNIKKSIKDIYGLWQLWEKIAGSLNYDSVTFHKDGECTIIHLPDKELSIIESIGIYWCNASENKYMQYTMSGKNSWGTVSDYYRKQFVDNCYAIGEFYKLASIIV